MLGIDMVHLPEFKKMMGKFPLEKLFLPVELSQNTRIESLAGIFAVKEAFFKTIGKKENWLDVWVEKEASGKPKLYSTLIKNSQKAQVSISHAGDYAIAVVLIEMRGVK